MNWRLTQLNPGDAFPPADQALPAEAPYPGLLAVGGLVDANSLEAAYAQGIFPWFGPDDPPLWWSPDPRMLLRPQDLKVRRSLRQSARRILDDTRYSLHVDRDFRGVMLACSAPRRDTAETWIVPAIVDAYCALHARGHAHSFELWRAHERVAGLYCVARGGMVFGESMFTQVDDGSKILLMALCGFCLQHALGPIDCQQQTKHLASMGAKPLARPQFLQELQQALTKPGPRSWQYDGSQFQRDCAPWL
jgi:leucyl/phenylalanyl-tRNA--protein transferase